MPPRRFQFSPTGKTPVTIVLTPAFTGDEAVVMATLEDVRTGPGASRGFGCSTAFRNLADAFCLGKQLLGLVVWQ